MRKEANPSLHLQLLHSSSLEISAPSLAAAQKFIVTVFPHLKLILKLILGGIQEGQWNNESRC
jgi:hypothetical protein